MALKTMSGIRVPVISQIVSLAIKKGVGDMSPIVRKAAALACVKCLRLDPSTRPQVEEYIATLLGDKQYYVAGAAVQAFLEICPARIDLVHPHYRSLVSKLVDMDEWGQLATLKLMTSYARQCFPRRTKRVKQAATREEKDKDFYDDEPADVAKDILEYDEIDLPDPDLDLLLISATPLLQSRNSAVIIAVTRLYLYLAPTTYLPNAIGPLIALLRSPTDIQHLALYNTVQVCLASPASFVPYYRHFLLRSTDPPQTQRLKLELLTLIFPHCAKEVQDLILAELEHFSRGYDVVLVRESVRAIGRCAQSSDAKTSRRCLQLLLRQMHAADQHLVGEAVEVIRHLIQRAPEEHRKTVIRLAKNLDTLTAPAARASIIWLVGEFAGVDVENNVAADVLRILVKGYVEESDDVRGQIVLLAAKVYLHHLNAKNAKRSAELPEPSSEITSPTDHEGGFNDRSLDDQQSDDKSDPVALLYQHTLLLARYTPSYDLRDRARLFRALLSVPSSTELASLLLLAPKPVPQAPSPSESRKGYALGSASLVVGAGEVTGYVGVPAWVEEGQEPDPRLREDGGAEREYVPRALAQKSVAAGARLDEVLRAEGGAKGDGGGRKEKTLEEWFDEEGEEEESSEESSEEETESEEESEHESEDENATLVR